MQASSGLSGSIEFQIRAACPDEAETLLAVQRAASVAAFAHIYPPERFPFPDDDVRSLWRGALADPQIDVYVAAFNGEAIGSVSVDDEWLRTLYVLPSHWSHGVGSELHDHAVARMRDRGATRAKLWTLEENWV